MKRKIPSITDAVCRVVETLQANPMGALVLTVLALCVVAAGTTWRR